MPSDAGALPLLRPRWPGAAGVGAAMSTRAGGASRAPYDRLNLGAAVGDEPAAVDENRRRFVAAIGAQPVWLCQVHGRRVVRIGRADTAGAAIEADAAWTDEPGMACTVQIADCLPVLLAARDGRAVAAAHAGWRGLAAGVVEATVSALCEGVGCAPSSLVAWLGPCIGPRQFEVGADVLHAFGVAPGAEVGTAFVRRRTAEGGLRWLADLQRLAREQLQRAGVREIAVETACTVEDGSRFFSYRRDGVTGRLAAAVWRHG